MLPKTEADYLKMSGTLQISVLGVEERDSRE